MDISHCSKNTTAKALCRKNLRKIRLSQNKMLRESVAEDLKQYACDREFFSLSPDTRITHLSFNLRPLWSKYGDHDSSVPTSNTVKIEGPRLKKTRPFRWQCQIRTFKVTPLPWYVVQGILWIASATFTLIGSADAAFDGLQCGIKTFWCVCSLDCKEGEAKIMWHPV